MDQKVKGEWLEALRSGNYEQGKYALCKPNKTYCCLGVLLDILKEDYEIDSDGYRIYPSAYPDTEGKERQCSSLPYDVKKRLNISDNETGRLIKKNDDGYESFNEIADWIERHL